MSDFSSATLRATLADMNPATRRAVEAQLTPQANAAPARPTGMAAMRASRTPGKMTKTEGLYAIRLDQMKDAKLIRGWKYEPVSLKLDNPDAGRAITYRPDFMLCTADGEIVFDEVKGGFIVEKGMLKFRFAVEQYPELHFRLWQWKKGVWTKLRDSEGMVAP